MHESDRQDICRLVESYFSALQGSAAGALVSTIALPFTECSPAGPHTLATEADLIAWWRALVARVRSESGMVRGAILNLAVEPLSASAALIRMESARLDGSGAVLSTHRTGFLAYRGSGGWRLSAVITELRPQETEARPQS